MKALPKFILLMAITIFASCLTLAVIYFLPESKYIALCILSVSILVQFLIGFKAFARIDKDRQSAISSASTIHNAHIAKIGKVVAQPALKIPEDGNLAAVMSELESVFRETLRREKSVVDNAADVICLIDSSGTILSANPASKSVLGYDPEELIGQRIESFFEGNAEQSLVEFLGAKESINKIIVENRFRRKDGSFVDLLWSAHWSASDDGLFCIAHDISQRKAADAAKQQLAQLKVEDEAMRKKMIDIIVHDIRSPLSSLLTTQALLLKGAFGELGGERMREKIELSQSEVERIIGLLNDLLKLTRYED